MNKWNNKHQQAIWDAFMDCGLYAVPSASNINNLVMQAAKKVFIEKPFYILEKMKTGLGNFWEGTSPEEIDCLYETFCVDSTNIFTCFDFSTDSPIEERLCSYLQRWMRNASKESLSLLLEYCSGSPLVDTAQLIKIVYVNRDPRHLAIGSKACFKILYLPKQFDTFNQFKTIMDDVLYSRENWSMYD